MSICHSINHTQDLDDYAWGEDSRRIIDAKRFWKKGWTEPETHGCLAFYDGYWSEEPCSERKTFFCVVGDFDGKIFTPLPRAQKTENHVMGGRSVPVISIL